MTTGSTTKLTALQMTVEDYQRRLDVVAVVVAATVAAVVAAAADAVVVAAVVDAVTAGVVAVDDVAAAAVASPLSAADSKSTIQKAQIITETFN